MRALDALIPARDTRDRMNLPEAFFNAGGLGYGLGGLQMFSVGGQSYVVPVATTLPGQKTESMATSFEGYTSAGFGGNSVVFALMAIRARVFSGARLQLQNMNAGQPGDLYGDDTLEPLLAPWPGGTTSDLLALMELHEQLAGNCYVTSVGGQLVVLRPDWVDIVLGDRRYTDSSGTAGVVGLEKVGYQYYQGGKTSGVKPVLFDTGQVCHFAPLPDPAAHYRGMSWLTPVVREVQADGAMVSHKLQYFQNAASPQLAVKLQVTDPTQFDEWVNRMDETHKGWEQAYKTLYLGAGADVTVIGGGIQDFRVVQGAGEVRIAQAAGVPPSVAGLADSLEGSSLNAGNFGNARRLLADGLMCPLWANVAGSLQVLIDKPKGTDRLWYDKSDIPFLREDAKDDATIFQLLSQATRELFMAGFEPDWVIKAVRAKDLSLLDGHHTGTFSIQVQEPGTTNVKLPSTVDVPPLGTEQSGDAAPQKPAGSPVGPAPAKPALPAPAAPAAGAGVGNGNGKK